VVACRSLYHTLSAQIEMHLAITKPARVRLALLVTGLIAAQSAVLAQIARHLRGLDLTAARETASIARRLRRTLNDAALTPACYLPAVRAALPHCLTCRPLLVALDESSHTDRIHLLRAAVPPWGNAVPLAWAVWEQNVPLAHGAYWQQVDQVLGQVAAVVPAAHRVCLLADRAYGVAPLLDRCTARGWQYVVRFCTGGSQRFRDAGGGRRAVGRLSGAPRDATGAAVEGVGMGAEKGWLAPRGSGSDLGGGVSRAAGGDYQRGGALASAGLVRAPPLDRGRLSQRQNAGVAVGSERGTRGGPPRGVACGDGMGKFAGFMFGGGGSGTGITALCGTRPRSPTASSGGKRVHPGGARITGMGVWHATGAVPAPITPRGADSWAAQWLAAQSVRP